MDFFVAQCSKLSDILELLIKSQKYKLGKGIYHDHSSTTEEFNQFSGNKIIFSSEGRLEM